MNSIIKKLTVGVLTASYVLSMSAFAQSSSNETVEITAPPTEQNYETGFSDVKSDDWFNEDLQMMVEFGIINGYEDGSFRPADSVTKGAILKMLCIHRGTGEIASADGQHWAQGYSNYAYNYSWTDSIVYDLDEPATRSFVAELIFASLRMVPDTRLQTPFADANIPIVNTLYDMGIVSGSIDYESGATYFKPDDSISRAETCVILGNVSEYFFEDYGVTDFRYQKPLAERPSNLAEPTQDGYIDLFEYMIVHDVFDYEIVYSNLGSDTFNNLQAVYDYRTIMFEAFEYVQDKYHELGGFYYTIGDTTSGNTQSATVTISIANEQITSSDQQFVSYKNDFILMAQDYCEDLYEYGIVSADMSQTDKAYAIYEQIAYDFAYDTNYQAMGYNGYGFMTNGVGVCQAYVGLYNTLCKMSGIEAVGVSGVSSGENHIWSYITVDGINTYVDPTWADPVPDTAGYHDPAWFGLSREQMSATHTFDEIYNGKIINLTR